MSSDIPQAVYQSLLQLTWIDELLDTVKTLFTTLYGEQLKKSNGSTIECHFDDYFNSRVQELEKKAGGQSRLSSGTATAYTDSPAPPDPSQWAPPPIPSLLKGMSLHTPEEAHV